jgi:predicted DNA-binding transcriptional regulator AlpA
MSTQTIPSDTTQSPDIVSLATFAKISDLSLTTIWRLRQRGDFPAVIQLSPGRVGIRLSDGRRWLETRQTKALAR